MSASILNPPPFVPSCFGATNAAFLVKPPPIETADLNDDNASTASTAVSTVSTPRGHDGPCNDYALDLQAAFGTCKCGHARREHHTVHALARRATVASMRDATGSSAQRQAVLSSPAAATVSHCDKAFYSTVPTTPNVPLVMSHGWITLHDGSGHTFYANTNTGETSWVPPVGPPSPTVAPAATPPALAPPGVESSCTPSRSSDTSTVRHDTHRSRTRPASPMHSWESPAATSQQKQDPWKLHRPAQHGHGSSVAAPKPPVAAPKPRRASESATTRTIATAAHLVEGNIASPGFPCAAFKLDVNADFGTCRCGHKKVAHSHDSLWRTE